MDTKNTSRWTGFYSWEVVRSFGELQILTRASYAMLVIVPMLAALWPGVRSAVNRYNVTISDARDSLDAAAHRLQFEKRQLGERLPDTNELQRLDDVVTELTESATAKLDAMNSATIEAPLLPATWALAFFASLCVAIGHMVYQWKASPKIQASSSDEYVSMQQEEYARHPVRSALHSAQSLISSEEKVDPQFRPPYSPYDRYTPDGDELDVTFEESRAYEIDVVGTAARIQWRREALKSPVARFVAACFYTHAIAIIAWIVLRQCWAVARAAGWA